MRKMLLAAWLLAESAAASVWEISFTAIAWSLQSPDTFGLQTATYRYDTADVLYAPPSCQLPGCAETLSVPLLSATFSGLVNATLDSPGVFQMTFDHNPVGVSQFTIGGVHGFWGPHLEFFASPTPIDLDYAGRLPPFPLLRFGIEPGFWWRSLTDGAITPVPGEATLRFVVRQFHLPEPATLALLLVALAITGTPAATARPRRRAPR